MAILQIGTYLNKAKAFYDDISGSFSVYFAIGFLGVFAVVTLTLDIANLLSANQKLQIMADNAAINTIYGNEELEQRGENFSELLYALANDDPRLENVESSGSAQVLGSELIVTGSVKANVKTLFAQNIGVPRGIAVDVEVRRGLQNVEIALALDISSSMSGTRIAEAKKASKSFIDILLSDPLLEGRVSMALIPFGGTVKLPANLSFLVQDTDTLTDPDYTRHWINNTWNQCLLYEISDLRQEIKPSDRFDTIEDIWRYVKSGSNPWCPHVGNEMITPTNDSDRLHAAIDSLTLSDGTGSDHGMLWARAALSPEWAGYFPDTESNLPRIHSEDTQKIIILMTDGGVTGQNILGTTDTTDQSPPYYSKYVHIKGKDARSNFDILCEQTKNDGTEIFTIGYLMSNGSHIKRLEDCASSNQNTFSSNSGELDATFEAIAAAITPTRISN